MIVSALLAARAFLAKLPWQLWVVLAVLLTAWLWGNHRYSQGYAASEAKHAETARKAVTKARTADEAARGTVDAEKRSADATEARAREAAAGSDDPLKSGLEALK